MARDYSQWHLYDDRPGQFRDQSRDLPAGYWAEIGPEHPAGWSWIILRFDGTDNTEIESGRVAGEAEAKAAAQSWADDHFMLHCASCDAHVADPHAPGCPDDPDAGQAEAEADANPCDVPEAGNR